MLIVICCHTTGSDRQKGQSGRDVQFRLEQPIHNHLHRGVVRPPDTHGSYDVSALLSSSTNQQDCWKASQKI